MLLFGDSMQRTVRTVFFLLRPRLLASASRGDEVRWGSYSNAPSRCSGASICSFLGTQCSAPLHGTVSFMRDCFRASAAQRGGGVGSYSNAPSRCSGASICSFLGAQCSAPLHGAFSFMRDCFRASAALSRIKETPPLIAGVRCIGRSYRNRTYTMGVRGPCATTTPSSNARMIIAHQAPTRE